MYPDQNQPGSAAPGPSNEYDFIMSPQSSRQPGKGLLPSGGGKQAKLFLIAIVGLVVVILLWIIAAVFSSGGGSTDNAVSIAQSEQEIIRVTTAGNDDIFNQKLRNVSANTQLSLSTQQQQWLAFLATEGVTLEEDRLGLKANTEIDTQLEEAQIEGNFDQTYYEILSLLLQSYASELQTAFNAASNETEKSLLAEHYQQTQLLVEQLPEENEL